MTGIWFNGDNCHGLRTLGSLAPKFWEIASRLGNIDGSWSEARRPWIGSRPHLPLQNVHKEYLKKNWEMILNWISSFGFEFGKTRNSLLFETQLGQINNTVAVRGTANCKEIEKKPCTLPKLCFHQKEKTQIWFCSSFQPWHSLHQTQWDTQFPRCSFSVAGRTGGSAPSKILFKPSWYWCHIPQKQYVLYL